MLSLSPDGSQKPQNGAEADPTNSLQLGQERKLFIILLTLRAVWGEAPSWLWVITDRSPPLRFSTGFAYYSLAMGVEEFGVNLYILQLIFGGVDVPAKFITMLAISYLGRHTTEAALLLLAGGCILSLIFVPAGETLPLPPEPSERGWPTSAGLAGWE